MCVAAFTPTCANKDGHHSRVKCGSGFLANPGSTRCTICNNDGAECCTRMLLICYCFLKLFWILSPPLLPACLFIWLASSLYTRAMQMHTDCSCINACQSRHARTKTDIIRESSAGPGCWQNLASRVARIATTMGLSAALVCYLIALFLIIIILVFVYLVVYTRNGPTAWQGYSRHARTKTDIIRESSAGPGCWQNLDPRVARIAKTTGLSAALVCYLFASVYYGFTGGFIVMFICGFYLVACTPIVNARRMFAPKFLPAMTCTNKDGFHSQVACGFGFLAKTGSTPCTTCGNDGTECCIRMLLVCACSCHT